jgi:hypothetical protein
MVMTLFLTPYSLLEPFFSLLSKKAYDPTEHGTYTFKNGIRTQNRFFESKKSVSRTKVVLMAGTIKNSGLVRTNWKESFFLHYHSSQDSRAL